MLKLIMCFLKDNIEESTKYIIKDLLTMIFAIKDFIFMVAGFLSFIVIFTVYIPYVFIQSFFFFFVYLKKIEEPYKRRCRIILDSKEKMTEELKTLENEKDYLKIDDIFETKVLRKKLFIFKKIKIVKNLIKEL